MLVLGDCIAGDVVRALEWLGPDLAGQAIATLLGRIGQDEWQAVFSVQNRLPVWRAVLTTATHASIICVSVEYT